MAGDWIKMRPSLLTSPKVNGIARIIEDDSKVGRILSTGFNGRMSEIVTRNVMRNVTVASLLTVWGAANEHTTDGIFKNADLSDIDDMVGIPGFGDAMASVGWAIFDDKEYSVILPNFNEYNTCGKDRAAEKNAERQRKHREKLKQDSNVISNVTVTLQSNVEKRREEKNNISPSLRSGDSAKSELSLLTEKEIPEQLAKDWLRIRKEKKQPLTETGLKATIREGAKLGYSLEQTITLCCENGWAGFRASYVQNKRDYSQQKPQYQSAADKQREQANRMFGGLTNERGREIDVSEDGAEWDRPALPLIGDNLR